MWDRFRFLPISIETPAFNHTADNLKNILGVIYCCTPDDIIAVVHQSLGWPDTTAQPVVEVEISSGKNFPF